MNKNELLKVFEQGLSQGISVLLAQVIPGVDPSSRNLAAIHVADLVTRVIDAGGFEALAKREAVGVAPKMDLNKDVK